MALKARSCARDKRGFCGCTLRWEMGRDGAERDGGRACVCVVAWGVNRSGRATVCCGVCFIIYATVTEPDMRIAVGSCKILLVTRTRKRRVATSDTCFPSQ